MFKNSNNLNIASKFLIQEIKKRKELKKIEKMNAIDSEVFLKGNKNPVQYTCCNVEITPWVKDYGRCPSCGENL